MAGQYQDVCAILGIALGVRLMFAFIIADTYDPDEFVVLGLGRLLAHGAVAYRDFMFFHPPGMLVLLRALDGVIGVWWPLARLFVILVDCGTALLIWRIGLELWGRRGAFAGALLYSVSPATLVAGVRVDHDPIITFLGMAALTLLIAHGKYTSGRDAADRGSRWLAGGRAELAAGVCLGIAVWIKYPAILFLPVCLLAAPRRVSSWMLLCGGFVAAIALLFLPFVPEWRSMVDQSIAWQLHRQHGRNRTWDLEKAAVFWLLINPCALAALAQLRRRAPAWLIVGFLTGGVYLLTAHAYYHYFVPAAAFGALLGAPVAARVIRHPPWLIMVGALAFAATWGIDINLQGPGRSFVTATRLSGIRPTVQLVRQLSGPHDRVLADRLEYAYLSGRPYVPYFWNMSTMVDSAALVRQLPEVTVVVRTQREEHTFPVGFDRYLWSHFRAHQAGSAMVWILDVSTHGQGPNRTVSLVRRTRAGSVALRDAHLCLTSLVPGRRMRPATIAGDAPGSAPSRSAESWAAPLRDLTPSPGQPRTEALPGITSPFLRR